MSTQQFLTDYDSGYDYSLDNTGDIKLISGSEEVALLLKQRLQFFLSEWVFDTKAGFPWFEQVFIKPVNISLVNSNIKRHILQTPGVSGLVDFQSDFEANSRAFRISFRYTDQYTDEAQSLAISVP